ncbi:hypothetical protein O181_064953 [Austropuccinia psidii MF-1]|uniref:Uncharacterized protein n=1 Tax=Austropuccinia psidii MF-1 TaxID=1389203 RepID=A0A9Q3EUH8_9BASI|nr:hypothetical protein [Austropuccinia psidii MF-1]
MRFFDPNTRRIIISRDYSPTTLKFNYNHKAILKKDPESLPSTPIGTLNMSNVSTAIEPLGAKTNYSIKGNPRSEKGYDYSFNYYKAPKDINGKVRTSKILPESRRKQEEPKGVNLATNTTDDEGVLLHEVVPVIDAMTNPEEREKWKEAMAEEFNSLVSKNTGTLVPAPYNQKIIGGMWCLTCKKNEFGEATGTKQGGCALETTKNAWYTIYTHIHQ